MTERARPSRLRQPWVGCLVFVLLFVIFVLVFLGVEAWRDDDWDRFAGFVGSAATLVGILVGLSAIAAAGFAAAWKFGQWQQRRATERGTGRGSNDERPQASSRPGRGTPNAEQRRGSTTREERAAPKSAVVDNAIRDATAHARPENRYRDGRPITGKVTVTVTGGGALLVDGKPEQGAVGLRLTEPIREGHTRSFIGEAAADLPLVAHRRIEWPGRDSDGKHLPLFYPDRLPAKFRPYSLAQRAEHGKELEAAVRQAAVGPEVTHLRFEQPDPWGSTSIVGYRAVADARDEVRPEDGPRPPGGKAKAAPIRDAGSRPAANATGTPSATKGAGPPEATRAQRRQREWRRVGAVLSAVTAVLACVPFGRSVSTLLRAYEAAEALYDREIGYAVMGLARYTGFPGLLHASAAVLMTAVTIFLFTVLALLLASDVLVSGISPRPRNFRNS